MTRLQLAASRSLPAFKGNEGDRVAIKSVWRSRVLPAVLIDLPVGRQCMSCLDGCCLCLEKNVRTDVRGASCPREQWSSSLIEQIAPLRALSSPPVTSSIYSRWTEARGTSGLVVTSLRQAANGVEGVLTGEVRVISNQLHTSRISSGPR